MTTPLTPTIGRQVHYRMSDAGAVFAAARRFIAEQALIEQQLPIQPGNPAVIGQYYPATITRVNGDGSLNLVVQLDGPDTLWCTSVAAGDEPNTWTWPPRV